MIIVYFFIALNLVAIILVGRRISDARDAFYEINRRLDELETLLYKINAETTCIANKFLIKEPNNGQKSTH